MIKRPVILLATSLSLLLGAVLLFRQHSSSTASSRLSQADAGTPARRNHGTTSSPAKFRHERADDSSTIKGLLSELTRWRDGGHDLDRETSHALADKLLQLDADAAAGFAESFPPGPLRDEALRRFAQGLAARDPEKAERWALTLSDETERSTAIANLCLQLARTNAGEAVRKAELHQLDKTSSLTVETLVQQWAGQDLPAATAWTLARPAGEQREQLCSRLAIVQSATEPVKAAHLVLEEIPEGQNQTEAIMAVLYQWATRDQEAAATWVAAFPPGPLRERAENELSRLAQLR